MGPSLSFKNMSTLEDYIKNLEDTPPSLDTLLSDSYAVAKELKVWREWFSTLQKKKELIQYKLGVVAAENQELTPCLYDLSLALDEACAYPIPEKGADSYLK